ncbi:MAG: three-Cys-motif partner protein TcmP [Bryobacteraceae bacterium]
MSRECDEVGLWSEMKLEIVRDYATEYSTIMSKQPRFKHIYIDGFAGAGVHLSRTTGDFIPGSPLNALNVEPPFKEYHFIDLDGHRTDQIRELAGSRAGVFHYEGDCNTILLEKVFPRADYDKYERALCLLDPYNIDLSWDVVARAGKMRSVEIFLNFMIMDINMNVLHNDPESVDPNQIARMNRFWGDDSWRAVMYDNTGNLFGYDEKVAGNEALAEAYRKRLREVAGFKFVPAPVPMRNSIGRTIYYLFFASPNATGHKIVEYIFNKYRRKGAA